MTTTVVHHLGKKRWKLPEESRTVLEVAVKRASTIAHRGSIVFQAYLFQQEVQVENKDFRKIINHCFQIVKSKNKVKR